ncbi:hypothetical protein OAG1_33880 [Agarivorans sp. OAG1]|nr:hypothetical protein OAG1_33880 [Agarivorans sp. OAG1]
MAAIKVPMVASAVMVVGISFIGLALPLYNGEVFRHKHSCGELAKLKQHGLSMLQSLVLGNDKFKLKGMGLKFIAKQATLMVNSVF